MDEIDQSRPAGPRHREDTKEHFRKKTTKMLRNFMGTVKVCDA